MTHWQTPPALDTRTWLSPAQRGVLRAGHTLTDCAACRMPPPAPKVAVRPVAKVKRKPREAPLLPDGVLAAGSHRAEVLVALATLGKGAHTTSSLIVAAWKHRPDLFGLKGYEETHPCSRAVLCRLSGDSGLVPRGWVTRPDDSVVMLTPLGRTAAHTLMAQAVDIAEDEQ